MNFSAFIRWIAGAPPTRLGLEPLLDAVDRVLVGLPEEDPRYAWMVAIEEKLLDGEIPVERLTALVRRFPVTEPDAEEKLEESLRRHASGLGDEQIRTAALQELQAALSDPGLLPGYIASMEQQLTRFWSDYSLEPAELKAAPERVGQRLLEEGYLKWREALDSLRHPQGGAAALELAREGNRLLLAVSSLETSSR